MLTRPLRHADSDGPLRNATRVNAAPTAAALLAPGLPALPAVRAAPNVHSVPRQLHRARLRCRLAQDQRARPRGGADLPRLRATLWRSDLGRRPHPIAPARRAGRPSEPARVLPLLPFAQDGRRGPRLGQHPSCSDRNQRANVDERWSLARRLCHSWLSVLILLKERVGRACTSRHGLYSR